jgi:acetyl/propionyl-CoA carboxylase alpha subunit
VYAEDPARGYLPQAGRLALYREPSMPGVRVDAGVAEGSEVPVEYDPLLAKLIAWGETREAARRRALAALNAFPILGVRTNQPLLRRILEHPRFAAGAVDTHFLEHEHDALTSPQSADDVTAAVAEAVARVTGRGPAAHEGSEPASIDPWDRIAPFHV